MAKSKSETKKSQKQVDQEKAVAQDKAKAESLQYAYNCPACTGVAIETSNKMLEVEIDCAACGKRIHLDDEKRYRKIKK